MMKRLSTPKRRSTVDFSGYIHQIAQIQRQLDTERRMTDNPDIQWWVRDVCKLLDSAIWKLHKCNSLDVEDAEDAEYEEQEE